MHKPTRYMAPWTRVEKCKRKPSFNTQCIFGLHFNDGNYGNSAARLMSVGKLWELKAFIPWKRRRNQPNGDLPIQTDGPRNAARAKGKGTGMIITQDKYSWQTFEGCDGTYKSVNKGCYWELWMRLERLKMSPFLFRFKARNKMFRLWDWKKKDAYLTRICLPCPGCILK